MEKTGLDQPVSIHFVSKEGSGRHASGLEDDPRWQLTRNIVDSPQFSKSPRLSQFLLYIVAKTLEGRQHEVSEQQIGVHVFGRPHGYRTVDDNIVRSYARHLRKRLAEYFASDDMSHDMRIEIPLGGYLPVFTAFAFAIPAAVEESLPSRVQPAPPAEGLPWSRPRLLTGICLLFVYSAALIWLTCAVQARMAVSHAQEPGHMQGWRARQR